MNTRLRPLVVSGQGRVLKNSKGPYSDALKKEVEAYFDVELPGNYQPEPVVGSRKNSPDNFQVGQTDAKTPDLRRRF